ncbi:disulfide bond formation protein B [Streptomyces sp. AV19]|uniref:disulfide bond formation protein B n=1 Tax=Streptomyces sp. AV19 TaxID=2793068 RepID=UPI0018FE36BC|nr:disulfide bond formation protein B [Streptomyces sp. AV19]MBH1939197.1 disulfide bond formation protein B [Streptomyces sp. AV19]MDG4536927.1 disulfide bond formation protein B [Streptomyces sp. AV19]
MATAVITPAGSARLSNRLGLWFAHAYVLGMCAVLGGAYFFQFGLWEYPCPMCLLQRMFFLLSALGPAYIIARSRKGAVTTREFASGWGWAAAVAICGSFVSAAQVLMHIVPPDPGYAGALFGLHLYTWALVAFVLAVLACGINLVLVDKSEPLDAGTTSPLLGKAARVTLAVLAFFALSNLVACFFIQGFHWQMSGDPTSYRFFTDLGL